jgi:endogenous inhibitor of DNA gyrase (YacG/DUF329 family)
MASAKCPTCGQALAGPATEWPHAPFCCHKCKLADLNRWFGERYGIAKEAPADEESADEE